MRAVRPSIRFALLVPVAAALTLIAAQAPPSSDDVRARYTKYEFQVPMRDGVKLFTSVYVPKDDSHAWPILLNRTPYSVAPYGSGAYRDSLGPSDVTAKEGYIFAYQDVRGRMQSEGEFVNMRPHIAKKAGRADIDESTDTWDTIDWLVKHVPSNNGRVGLYGISYPGFYSAAGMIDAHPALKAVSPQAPISDWFAGDDFHHNGALWLPHAFNFFAAFGRRPTQPGAGFARFDHGTPDGYRWFLDTGAMPEFDTKWLKGDVPFWRELMAHEAYDEFWQARNLRPHLKGITPAVMTVGGWFDAENLYGSLQIYRAVESQSPATNNRIVMGPWFHGGWARSDGDALGDVRFDSRTGAYYREQIEAPFFRAWLKQEGEPPSTEAWMFETGTNVWRRFDVWPPKAAVTTALYLRENGTLAFEAPPAAEGLDEYVSDPARPVPFVKDVTINMTREYMVDDQRFASTRPDVLVYQTAPLAEDVTIAGPVAPKLVVSTSGTDADWVVKLIDVYPGTYPDPAPNPRNVRMGDYQQLVRGDVMRGKFRNSLARPEPFAPDQPTRVEFAMNDVLHTFRRGHRIMIQIQSTWFPLVNRNPQVFTNINTAPASAYQKARQRVYRSAAQASRIEVGVMR